MCYHEECFRPFDAWGHLPLTVVAEALISAPIPAVATGELNQHQVQVTFRLSTGEDQVLFNLHSIEQIKVLAGPLSEMVASLDPMDEAGSTEPLLITKIISAPPTRL